MQRSRSLLLVALVAGCALASLACTSDDEWSGADRSTGPAGSEATPVRGAQWDLVATASDATVVDPSSDGGAALLRLESPGEVEVFTDRPRRIAGSLTVPGLVDLWSRGAFGQDPPNAVLVLGGRPHPVELASAAALADGSVVVFELRPLRDVQGRPVELPGGGRHEDPVLFIDAVTVDPQVTDAITQTNVKVVGEAPAESMGSVYQTIGDSTGVLGGGGAGAPPASGGDGLIGVGPDGDQPPPGVSAQVWALLNAD